MAQHIDDPRLQFLESLDLSASRIELSNSAIVLVCGGPVPDPKLYPEAPDPPIASLRHAISKVHTSFEIFRPEEIKNWHSDAVFKDLVSFERALASICSLIVIILESAGSMAELGAFSQLPELSEKSITICSSEFDNHISFINLGILRFLTAKDRSRVKRYPWNIKNPEQIAREVIDDAISDIQLELEKSPKSTALKIDHDFHCMVMISELLRLFIALKESEILDYLVRLRFKVDADQLRGRIFVLQSFNIIKTSGYSDAIFYISGPEPYHRLRLAAIDKRRPIDVLRIETLCLDFYRADSRQKNRHRTITQLRVGAEK